MRWLFYAVDATFVAATAWRLWTTRSAGPDLGLDNYEINMVAHVTFDGRICLSVRDENIEAHWEQIIDYVKVSPPPPLPLV